MFEVIKSRSDYSNPWEKADALWFEQNKNRAYHSRRPFPGELSGFEKDDAPSNYLMLVYQPEPGHRLRQAMLSSADAIDDEGFLKCLFEVLINARQAGLDYVRTEDFQRRSGDKK